MMNVEEMMPVKHQEHTDELDLIGILLVGFFRRVFKKLKQLLSPAKVE